MRPIDTAYWTHLLLSVLPWMSLAFMVGLVVRARRMVKHEDLSKARRIEVIQETIRHISLCVLTLILTTILYATIG